MKIFGNNCFNFWPTMKFEGEVKILPNLEPKNCESRQILWIWMPFLHKFVALKELTAGGLTDSSWNTLENIRSPHELTFFIWSILAPSHKVNLPPRFRTLKYFKRCQSLELSSSTLGEERQMHPLTFLFRIQCSTTLIWSIFGYNTYFWQYPALKWIYFLVFEH